MSRLERTIFGTVQKWSRGPEPGCRVSTGRVPAAGLLHADDSRHGAVAVDDGSDHPQALSISHGKTFWLLV